MLLALSATGCFDMRVVVGRRPNLSALEGRLTLGQSTREDVFNELGPPEGKGREMLPVTAHPRTMWSYYYEEGSLGDARRLFLFVYFDVDVYDGYMWFSSLPP